METEILTGPNCLANQNPRLGETVHGAEKGRHQNEALHVSNLRIGVADILQHESPVRNVSHRSASYNTPTAHSKPYPYHHHHAVQTSLVVHLQPDSLHMRTQQKAARETQSQIVQFLGRANCP